MWRHLHLSSNSYHPWLRQQLHLHFLGVSLVFTVLEFLHQLLYVIHEGSSCLAVH